VRTVAAVAEVSSHFGALDISSDFNCFFSDDEDAARVFGPCSDRPGLRRRRGSSAGLQVPAEPLCCGGP